MAHCDSPVTGGSRAAPSDQGRAEAEPPGAGGVRRPDPLPDAAGFAEAGAPAVAVALRLVLPGVLRDPDVYADRGGTEQRYFLLDVGRTAAFLGLPYREARPYPVEFLPGTLYRAAERQPRVFRLYYLTAAAVEIGRGWDFLDVASRLIWDGTTENWQEEETLRRALARSGLDYEALAARAESLAAELATLAPAGAQVSKATINALVRGESVLRPELSLPPADGA